MYFKLALFLCVLLTLGCSKTLEHGLNREESKKTSKNDEVYNDKNTAQPSFPLNDNDDFFNKLKAEQIVENSNSSKAEKENLLKNDNYQLDSKNLISEKEQPLATEEKYTSEVSSENLDEKIPGPQESSLPTKEVISHPKIKEEIKTSQLDKILPKNDSLEIMAPSHFKHPLEGVKNLVFMLGEDDKGYYLYGEGAFLENSYEKFLEYIDFYKKQNIKLDRIMLHSPGGIVNEGLKIGHYIQENRWTTDSDKYMKCYSTCGFIFASGVNKRFQQGAEIGFHRPYLLNEESDSPEFIQKVYKDYLPFWIYIGGNKSLYDEFMSKYGRDSMLILDDENIDSYMEVERYR